MDEHALPARIEDRVLEILDGPEDTRDGALEGLCRDHPEHAALIRKRLVRTMELRAQLEERQPAQLPPPERIGPYKILEVLGEGGMGTVYKAEQREPVRRLVALKVIKLGMDSKEVLARFELERRALGAMNHSNIAKVLDAGTSEAGQP